MAGHPRWTRPFLSDDDFVALAEAIRRAEAGTSAEIRLHLERRVPGGRRGAPPDPMARARHVFAHLGMHRTAERHGVLIYLALEDRKLAVIGDAGIHGQVGEDYWARVRDLLVERLRTERPRPALEAAIAEVGRVLARHYPRRPDDTNELRNEVSLG